MPDNECSTKLFPVAYVHIDRARARQVSAIVWSLVSSAEDASEHLSYFLKELGVLPIRVEHRGSAPAT